MFSANLITVRQSKTMKTLQILTFFTISSITRGLRIETVSNWTAEGFYELDTFMLNGTLYQSRVEPNKLFLYIIEKENPVNCEMTNEKVDNSTFLVENVKKLKNGKTLVKLNNKVAIVNSTSCTIDSIIDVECLAIIKNKDWFDCRITGKFEIVKRYSYNGDFIGSFVTPNVFPRLKYMYSEFEEFDVNKSYFLWIGKNGETQLKIINSTYDVVRRNHLKTVFDPNPYYSLAHDNFTTCEPWFTRNRQNFNSTKFIECILVNWKDEPTNITVDIPSPTKPNEIPYFYLYDKNIIAVHNLRGGGAIVLFNPGYVNPPSVKVFFRIIDAQGHLSGEEMFFEYKSEMKFESYFFGMYVFERDHNICVSLQLYVNKFIIKCVEIRHTSDPSNNFLDASINNVTFFLNKLFSGNFKSFFSDLYGVFSNLHYYFNIAF